MLTNDSHKCLCFHVNFNYYFSSDFADLVNDATTGSDSDVAAQIEKQCFTTVYL